VWMEPTSVQQCYKRDRVMTSLGGLLVKDGRPGIAWFDSITAYTAALYDTHINWS